MFSPYDIHPIDLSCSWGYEEIDTNGRGKYMVFWWKDIALGHFYIRPDEKFTKKEYCRQLTAAIKPAISSYMEELGRSNEDLQECVCPEMFENWKRWMSISFSKITDFKIPLSVPITAIICTRGRPVQLRRCMTSLLALACLPEEIVIVDNVPPDDSAKDVVREFQEAKPHIKYVAELKPGLDYARNAGINGSTLPIVAFIDDDVVVHTHWAYRVWEAFQHLDIQALTGLIIASSLDTEAQFIFEKYWSFNRGYVEKVYGQNYFKAALATGPPVWEIGAGANMAFRKSIFLETGYFNPMLDVGAAGCNGDSELWFRILAKGYAIHYNPKAIAIHEHRKEMSALKKQLFYYMRGFATAALVQQSQIPEAGYKRHRLRQFPRYYWRLMFNASSSRRLRLKTVFVEIYGIIAGVKYYFTNRKRTY